MTRQNQILFGLGVAAWSLVVFVVTLYLTFPSDAVVARIEQEAPRFLGRDYEVDIESASPWWIGVSMNDVAISQRASRRGRRGRGGDDEADGSLVAYATNARVRTSLFSLLRQTPYVTGSVRLGDGRVDFDVTTQTGNRQALEVSRLVMEADQLPLSDLVGSPALASALGGFTMAGSGAVDLEVDLTAGERGMADGVGRVALVGSDLSLTDIASDTTGPLGIDVPIRDIDIVAEVDGGKGEIKKGRIDSDLFRLEITGDFGLRDPLPSSTINFEIELSDISSDLSLVETMLRSALGATPDNGVYTFSCRGMVARLNARSCRAEGARGGRTRRASRSAAGRPPRRRSGPGSTVSRSGARPEPPPNSDDRERRRQEIRERLRQRAAARAEDDVEDLPEDLEDFPEDVVDDFVDEEPMDEDLEYEEEDYPLEE